MEEILVDAKGATIAVCSHRVVLKALFCAMVGSTAPQAFYSFKIDPAAMSVVQYDQGFPVIVSFNDARHIRGDDLFGGPADF